MPTVTRSAITGEAGDPARVPLGYADLGMVLALPPSIVDELVADILNSGSTRTRVGKRRT